MASAVAWVSLLLFGPQHCTRPELAGTHPPCMRLVCALLHTTLSAACQPGSARLGIPPNPSTPQPIKNPHCARCPTCPPCLPASASTCARRCKTTRRNWVEMGVWGLMWRSGGQSKVTWHEPLVASKPARWFQTWQDTGLASRPAPAMAPLSSHPSHPKHQPTLSMWNATSVMRMQASQETTPLKMFCRQGGSERVRRWIRRC